MHTLVSTAVCIGINPFILVISIPYLLCAHATYKHQLLYVYTPLFETGALYDTYIYIYMQYTYVKYTMTTC
jgi:hypothetical protein